jgi:hypothetical protein
MPSARSKQTVQKRRKLDDRVNSRIGEAQQHWSTKSTEAEVARPRKDLQGEGTQPDAGKRKNFAQYAGQKVR